MNFELGFESQSNLYQEASGILIRGLRVVTFPKIISLIIAKLTCIKPLRPGSRGHLFRSRPNEQGLFTLGEVADPSTGKIPDVPGGGTS